MITAQKLRSKSRNNGIQNSIGENSMGRQLKTIGTIGLLTLMTAACGTTNPALTIGGDANGNTQLAGSTDPYAASAISAADWDQAAAILEGRLDEDPLKLLNLAYVYRQTGKTDAAAALYQSILDGSSNPYAERPGSVPLRVKTIARRAIASLTVQPE